MESIELLIVVALVGGLIAFLTGRLNKVLGSIITIVVSGFIFVVVAFYGINGGFDTTLEFIPYFEFTSTSLGSYFAIIVVFVYFMVSFFNPYFITKYKYPGLYSLLFLFSLAGVLGVFFAQDFLTLFFFFELVVWSSLLLIPLGTRKKSATWYYGFSLFGSFSLLFAILFMQSKTGNTLIDYNLAQLTGSDQTVVFFLLLIAGFAKLGAFPLHIWLPKVLGSSPDPVSSIFSGGLEKLGAFVAVFALVKIAPIGPQVFQMNIHLGNYFIAVLGAMTIVFGTLMAIRQDDAKKLLAYSSMSNGGYILLALSIGTTASISGALYHVLAHAIASTAAFLAIGAVNRQTGTTKMSELGGMIHKMPISYMVYLIAIISMAGIPPMGGFISKWLIFQSVIDEGLIFLSIATFFGSIGSFLYVFRPLAALFLGQELPQFKNTIKEAPFFMLIPMLILSGLNVFTGVTPTILLKGINSVLVELGVKELDLIGLTIKGTNGVLDPVRISAMFGVGVFIAFLIFISLKKSKKVELMDTYTAGNFIYTEELMHYSVDFYAPLERIYEKYINIMKDFYKGLANKVKEFGAFVKYFFFTHKPEIMVFWIILVIGFLLWGDLV